MITWKKVLNFLDCAWECVCAFAVEIVMSIVVLAVGGFFVMIIGLAIQEADEKEARLEYCYKQGYVEVIESKHDPRYYCFDARRTDALHAEIAEESSPIASIPKRVWEDE